MYIRGMLSCPLLTHPGGRVGAGIADIILYRRVEDVEVYERVLSANINGDGVCSACCRESSSPHLCTAQAFALRSEGKQTLIRIVCHNARKVVTIWAYGVSAPMTYAVQPLGNTA